eukprot:sb/3462358/
MFVRPFNLGIMEEARLFSTGFMTSTVVRFYRVHTTWLEESRGSGGEQRLRASIFRANIQEIAAHDAEAAGWSQELNMFADMTEEEKASYTGFNASAMVSDNADEEVLPHLGNPSEKDWRGVAVTSIKNQGNCGSCWIFSGFGALEGHYKIQGGSLTDFAEQEGLDCIKRNGCGGGIMTYDKISFRLTVVVNGELMQFDPPYYRCRINCGSCWIFSGFGALEGHYKIQGGSLTDFAEQEGLDCIKRNGCSGGIMSDVFDWLKKSGRVGATRDIRYTARQGSCNYNNKPNALTAFKVTGYTNARGDSAHVTALATSGPLSVGYSVANDFMRYRGGIYNNRNCNGGGHAVVSVGYTSTYFRMKNSWGSRWGESGFFRIARGNVCGITDMGFAPRLASTVMRDEGDEDGESPPEIETKMIFFTLLIGVSTALNAAPEVLQSALSNPTAFRALFSEYQAAEGRNYVGGEQRLRASIFRANIQEIAAHDAEEAGWSQELNMFADMTEEEKASYTGFNASAMVSDNADEEVLPHLGNPSEKDWRGVAVTSIKNQGNCGSCWIFSGFGALEGHYKIQGGSLTDFAEQEGLDCIKRNGCGGGIMTYEDIRYTARQGSCNYNNKPNALTAFKVTGYTNARGDSAHVTALATSGPLSVGYSVANDFMRYRGGIYNNRNCNGGGHAVVSVGYTSTYFRMKNSWGSRWGESGFFRIARGNVCGITDMGFAPRLASTVMRDEGDEDGKDCPEGWKMCPDGKCIHVHWFCQ